MTKYDKDLNTIANSNSYNEVSNALLNIGKDFGLTKQDFEKNFVKKENLFINTDEVLVIE